MGGRGRWTLPLRGWLLKSSLLTQLGCQRLVLLIVCFLLKEKEGRVSMTGRVERWIALGWEATTIRI
jgi:hypothetical protein